MWAGWRRIVLGDDYDGRYAVILEMPGPRRGRRTTLIVLHANAADRDATARYASGRRGVYVYATDITRPP